MFEALKEAWLAKSRDATPEEVPVKHAKGWVVRWTARKIQGEVKVKHGDTYLGTPKGQSLRSLKAAERWLGLAPPPPPPPHARPLRLRLRRHREPTREQGCGGAATREDLSCIAGYSRRLSRDSGPTRRRAHRPGPGLR